MSREMLGPSQQHYVGLHFPRCLAAAAAAALITDRQRRRLVVYRLQLTTSKKHFNADTGVLKDSV